MDIENQKAKEAFDSDDDLLEYAKNLIEYHFGHRDLTIMRLDQDKLVSYAGIKSYYDGGYTIPQASMEILGNAG